MALETVDLLSLGISGFVFLFSVAIFHLARKRISRLESRTEELEDHQAELRQMEKYVLEKNPEYEDFEQTVSNLSEKLFDLIKDRYGLEGVTTYEEMIDSLEGLENDDEIINDLITFFEYLEDIEYSEEEIGEKDKALVRQAAFRLLRRAGPALEELEGRTEEE